jgi:hypothetical protein
MDGSGRLSGWAFGDAKCGKEPGYLERLKELARRLAEQEAANHGVPVLSGSEEYTLSNESDRSGCARPDRERIVVQCTIQAAGLKAMPALT